MKNPVGTLKINEIAEILGISRSAVNRKAKKQGWKRVWLPTDGGQTQFVFVEKLPEPVRSKLIGVIPPIKRKPNTDSKIQKAIDYTKRATAILEHLTDCGYEKKEINRILSLAKQSLRMPREIKPPTKEGES